MRRWVITLAAGALIAAAPAHAATDPLRERQWGLDLVEADAAHLVTRGEGAVVAVIDSGVDYVHPDLSGVFVPGYDFVEHDDDAYDQNGHGTHVAGIIAANTANGLGVSGVAPAARILPLRTLNADNEGSTASVGRAVDMAVERGANVINLSLGALDHASDSDFAVERAIRKGVVVIVAAGGPGDPGCSSTTPMPGLLCVGSVDGLGRRSPFSATGRGVSISAPGGLGGAIRGANVLSTYRSGGYRERAGTSQAAPHVAGVAALLVSLGLRGPEVTNRLVQTAVDAGAPGADPDYGSGVANARRAVDPDGTRLAAPGLNAPATIGRRALRRRGLPFACSGVRAGRCRLTARAGGRFMGRGTVRVSAGITVPSTLRLTRGGRRELRRADRLDLIAVIPGVSRAVRARVRLR